MSYTFIVYFTTSYFAYADGAWHQTVLRDTSFTPSHNILFYGCIPLYLTFGVGGFLYAMTRLPSFGRAISIAYTFAVLGPALILPNLGFNEWGHAYWMTEEIFQGLCDFQNYSSRTPQGEVLKYSCNPESCPRSMTQKV